MKTWTYLILFFIVINYRTDAAQPIDKSISWQGSAPGGFAASIDVNSNHLSLDQLLIIHLTLTFPPTHQPQLETLIPRLLSYSGFGAPPFTLKSQQLDPKTPPDALNKVSQQLTIILSPQIPGMHYLTFYEIPFVSTSAKNDETIKIVSGIVSVEVNMPPSELNPALIMAPPMPLSSDLPIAISTLNRRAFITNADLANEAAAYNTNALHSKAIPWQIFPVVITLLVLILIIKLPLRPLT